MRLKIRQIKDMYVFGRRGEVNEYMRFFSSAENLEAEYYEAGFEVGRLIAKGGHTLVFGGYTKGIMGAVARGVQENGGKVISVIPAVFAGKRPNFEDGATVILADTMSSRKNKKIEFSDAFISLPGGIGTIDELFQVLAMNAVGESTKPVAILMQGETQKALSRFLSQAVKEGFVSRAVVNKVGFCENAEELLNFYSGF